MADNFDAEEIIYNIIKSCGVTVFKNRSPRDQSGEHIIVRSIVDNKMEVVNVDQTAVNIFIVKPKDGMVNRARVKAVRTLVEGLIENASKPAGYYCVIDQSFSALLEDTKEGFDCFTIRYELTLNT